MKTEQEKAELVALYRAGTPVQTLREKIGVCKSTAYNWIKKFSPIKRTSCRRTVTLDSYYRLEREMQTLRAENEIIRRSLPGDVCRSRPEHRKTARSILPSNSRSAYSPHSWKWKTAKAIRPLNSRGVCKPRFRSWRTIRKTRSWNRSCCRRMASIRRVTSRK